MNHYIFLTDEGYTYQPNSESDVPDIENLQVIGITNGENEKDAFYNLIDVRKYLLSTSFDKIFCYRLASDYKVSYSEFSIKYDYDLEKDEEKTWLITKIKENMDLDIEESNMVFDALLDITGNNIFLIKEIISHESYCNYYLYANNFYELSSMLCDDEGLIVNDNFREDLYKFLINEQDEMKLKKRLKSEGWFISGGFAICLDDDILVKIINNE